MATGNVSHDIFERHLDLRPLRGRRRGLVLCPLHSERTPSFSVDLDAAVFCCHGCGAKGGYKKFAELIGEASPQRERFRSLRSPMAEARRQVLCDALRQPWNRETVRLGYEAADALKLADRVQRVGVDTEDGWEQMTSAAALSTAAEAMLADLVLA